jgi:hypothetical protein
MLNYNFTEMVWSDCEIDLANFWKFVADFFRYFSPKSEILINEISKCRKKEVMHEFNGLPGSGSTAY